MVKFSFGNLWLQILILLVVVVTGEENHGLDSRSAISEISSPRITKWGTWGSWKFCHEGDYVVAVRLRVERSQGSGDDTGLNGIRLRCQSLSGRSSYEIKSSEGIYGDWLDWDECNGIATGFELRSESRSQGIEAGDQSGAIDFTLLCGGPGSKYETKTHGLLSPGSWSGIQKCPQGYAVCGLQTQVESHPGSQGDDTMLNNVDLACCKIENPATTCTNPTRHWQRLNSCSANEECSARYQAEISYNGDASGNTASKAFYDHFGFGLEKAHQGLLGRFGNKIEVFDEVTSGFSRCVLAAEELQ